MYQGSYQVDRAPKGGQERRKRAGQAGIAGVAGCSFDDVRISYFSPRPVQYKEPAHGRGVRLHVSSGQEGHSEREPYGRRQVQREADPGAGEGQVSGQGVLQGRFVKVSFGKAIYEKKIKDELEKMLAMEQENGLNVLGGCGDIEKIFEKFMDIEKDGKGGDGYKTIYEKLQEIAERTGLSEGNKSIARLDVLLDFMKHFEDETNPPAGGRKSHDHLYEHYHVYGEDTVLTEGSRVEDTADLRAAIDCDVRSITHDKGVLLEKVLWIESFLSFQKGMGKELLRNVLREKTDVENVALGAYPGSEAYYSNALGMERLQHIYVAVDGKTYLNVQEALGQMRDDGKQGEEEEDKKEQEKKEEEKVERGISEGFFYPVYHASKETVMKKIAGESSAR